MSGIVRLSDGNVATVHFYPDNGADIVIGGLTVPMEGPYTYGDVESVKRDYERTLALVEAAFEEGIEDLPMPDEVVEYTAPEEGSDVTLHGSIIIQWADIKTS